MRWCNHPVRLLFDPKAAPSCSQNSTWRAVRAYGLGSFARKHESLTLVCKIFLVLLTTFTACTGSNELEKDYQIVLGMSNQPTPTGVLANCTNQLGTTGGLLRIDSRRLDGSNPTGQCSFTPTSSPPFDLERSFNGSATGNLFVSLPKAGVVQARSSTLGELWTYPSATVALPATQTEFCPTQLALSSSEIASTNAPSESLLFVLDDPANPQSGCTTKRTEPRVTALNRDGTRKGWVGLSIANRSNGGIQIAASSTELYILYADNGTAYRVARLPISGLVENTPSSSLQISDPIPGVLSSPNTTLTLGFSPLGTVTLLVGVGGSSGVVLPVTFNTTINRPEFGAALRETTETSELVGATRAIFWNRDASQKPLTIFARERPDVLLRRVQSSTIQRQSRGLSTTDGVFTPDGFFWGLHNSTLYRLDVFNFPNLQLSQNPSPLSDASISAINWIVGN
jgi:hypothetical protein